MFSCFDIANRQHYQERLKVRSLNEKKSRQIYQTQHVLKFSFLLTTGMYSEVKPKVRGVLFTRKLDCVKKLDSMVIPAVDTGSNSHQACHAKGVCDIKHVKGRGFKCCSCAFSLPQGRLGSSLQTRNEVLGFSCSKLCNPHVK